MTPEIYISITQGDQRIIIDGSIDLLKKFMTTFSEGSAIESAASTVCNPAPQQGDNFTRR